MSLCELLGVAEGFLGAVGMVGAPVDMVDVAQASGLAVVDWSRPWAQLRGREIAVPATAHGAQRQALLAHELGHFALDWADVPQAEQSAEVVGEGLLVPRALLRRDVRHEWDLARVAPRYLAAADVVARRWAQDHRMIATWFDAHGIPVWRYCPHERIPRRVRSRASMIEVGLAAQAIRAGDVAHGDDGCTHAAPMGDGGACVLARLDTVAGAHGFDCPPCPPLD